MNPQVRRKPTSDEGFERTKDGGHEGFHSGNVYQNRAACLGIGVHPEVPQCYLDDLLKDDCGHNLLLCDPVSRCDLRTLMDPVPLQPLPVCPIEDFEEEAKEPECDDVRKQ